MGNTPDKDHFNDLTNVRKYKPLNITSCQNRYPLRFTLSLYSLVETPKMAYIDNKSTVHTSSLQTRMKYFWNQSDYSLQYPNTTAQYHSTVFMRKYAK